MSCLLGRVRGPGVLSVRARRKLAGGWGALLLARAAHRWAASTYQGNGPWVDRNGGLVAWKGAAGQAAVIDAGLVLPALSGNYASTPDSAALSVTGDLSLRVEVLAGDLPQPPGLSNVMIAKSANSSVSAQSFLLWSGSTTVTFRWSDGSALRTVSSDVYTPPTATAKAFRVDLDVDDGAGGHSVTFYEADAIDGPWVQIGSVKSAGAFTTSVHDSSADVEIGTRYGGTSLPWVGTVRAAEILDGVSVVASPDFAAADPGVLTVTDDQSNVWTINQTADGSDDPTMESTPDTGHVSFPLTADNTVSTPKQGGWTTVEWEVFFADDTSETGTTTADPVVVGGTGITKSDAERVELHDGVGGAVVADLDIERDFDGDHNTITSTETGEVWTVNRATLAVGFRTSIVVSAKPRYGGAQHFRFAPPALFTTDAWTIAVPFRSHAQTAAGDGLLRMNSTAAGYIDMYLTSTADMVRVRRDGDSTGPDVANVDTVSVHDGALHVAVARWDGASLTMTVDSTDDQAVDSSISGDTIAAFDIGYIGSLSSGIWGFNGEDLAPLFYGTVLTDDEVDVLCTQLGAGT